MRLTFKQFSEALAIAEAGGECPDFISEGPFWDKFKASAKSGVEALAAPSDAEVRALTAAALRGDKKKQAELDDYMKASDKRKIAASNLAHTAAVKAHEKIRATQNAQVKSAQGMRPDIWAGRDTERRA